jgi:uncharacterized protein
MFELTHFGRFLSQPESLLALAVIGVAMLVRGTFGFGDALVAMPLLLLLVGIDVAAPLVALLSVTLAAMVLWQDWRHVHLRDAAALVVSALAGIVVGLLFLARANEAAVTAGLGGVIVLFSGYVLLHPEFTGLQTERAAPLFGLAAGILSGAYNAPGPPLVVYGALRRWSAEKFRATMQAFFLPTATAVVVGHGLSGRLGAEVLTYYVASLPLVAACVVAGRRLNACFDTAAFTRTLHVLLLLLGTALIARAVWSLIAS